MFTYRIATIATLKTLARPERIRRSEAMPGVWVDDAANMIEIMFDPEEGFRIRSW